MISKVLYAFERGFGYLRSHPQIIFALIWVFLIPLIFLYTGERFLESARATQDRLGKDKIGLMHDTFVSLARASQFDSAVIQREIDYIASINSDITEFAMAELRGEDIVFVASLEPELVGVTVEDQNLFRYSMIDPQSTITYESYDATGRVWQALRTVNGQDGQTYFLYSKHSLRSIDDLISYNESKAYWSLIIIYIVVLALAYWQIRNTNYLHLYSEAKKANETKDLFTNIIVHELRAPLTAIRGYASMVFEAKDASPDHKQYAERIKLSSERLLTIVNDLLDVARIQSGKLSIAKQQADVSPIIQAVIDELRISASEKNIAIVPVGADVSHMAFIDPKRLQQALTNLVSNSIKYTKQGSIEISLEEKTRVYEIRIKDTGMGMSAADQKNLFAPFYRVESDDVSQITGTGLGMWITRQLLELMGAKIDVESIKGVGTHIVVTIDKTT